MLMGIWEWGGKVLLWVDDSGFRRDGVGEAFV